MLTRLLTTTLGSFPKPAHVPVVDWFQEASMATVLAHATGPPTAERQRLLDDATRAVIVRQVQLGIDVPTDGEVRRENYVHYHCRHLGGFDFDRLTERVMRAGTWRAAVPTIVGDIQPNDPFLVRDWQTAQSFTDRPVKMTLPGPMTIADSVADRHYGDERVLGAVLADALNAEVRALAAAGCRWIQVDEPVLLRYTAQALAYGIEHVERCFRGVDGAVRRVLHVCRGYPDRLDRETYPRAPAEAYDALAAGLNAAEIDVLCLEAADDADFQRLERFEKKTITLGVVDIGRSRVETVEEIARRLERALAHVDADRLVVSPNCGMGMLSTESAVGKLSNMVTACRTVESREAQCASR